MDYISSICFLIKIKKPVMRLFVYLLSSLLCTNVNAATSSISFFHGQLHNNRVVAENMLKIDIFYYRNFSYRQRYAHQEIKGCIKIPARGIVRCKESVSLIRPESQVNGWLHSQYEKGYLPLTMKSFGVTNTVGHINKVTPVGFLSVNKKMDNLKSPYVPATGLFIRHVPDVREYTFKNIKTNVIFSVKATPEHPVYAANRRDFIPVSQLSPEDHLLSDNGDKIQLLCHYGINQGIKKGCGIPFNQGGITRVYNIETSWRHTYFVQRERLLVHNCNDAPDNTIQGRTYNRDQIRLFGRRGNNIEFSEPMPLDSFKSIKNEKFRNSPGLSFINREGEKVEIAGAVDSENYIGHYSELDDLYVRNGRLLKGRFFSMPVEDKLDDFNFNDEFSSKNKSLNQYEKGVNEINASKRRASWRNYNVSGILLVSGFIIVLVLGGGDTCWNYGC